MWPFLVTRKLDVNKETKRGYLQLIFYENSPISFDKQVKKNSNNNQIKIIWVFL
jgi:hypothetical protein